MKIFFNYILNLINMRKEKFIHANEKNIYNR